MKYLVLIYGNQELWESFPPEEWPNQIEQQDAFNRKFTDSGELLGAYGLADAIQAKVLKVRDGVPAVTDGPYLETKEYMSSAYLLDVEDEARALVIAAEIPFAAFRQVEVWPILHEASAAGSDS